MSKEKLKQEEMVGGKLSDDEVRRLLEKYGDKGLKASLHPEFLQIGSVQIQKLKTVGMMQGKPKPIERRIKELLGLEEEKW